MLTALVVLLRSIGLICRGHRAARTVAERGIHQNDAETILKRLNEIEACQRHQAAVGR